jgi:Mg-chelatase subunit ChlD
MKQTNALKRLLQDMSAIYNGGKHVPVEFAKAGEMGSAALDGSKVHVAANVREFIGRDLDGPNELRVIVDTLSHEIEHIRESNLTGKRDAIRQYGAYGQLAGTLVNICEDAYIDWSRTKRHRGLRVSHAFVIDEMMKNNSRRPHVGKLSKSKAMVEGFWQVASAGYAKHLDEADDDVVEFLTRARVLVEQIRREDDLQRREELTHRVVRLALEYLPDADEAQDYSNNIPTDAPASVSEAEIDAKDLPEDVDDIDTSDVSQDDVDINLDDPDDDAGDADADADDENADANDDTESNDGEHGDPQGDAGDDQSDDTSGSSDSDTHDDADSDDVAPDMDSDALQDALDAMKESDERQRDSGSADWNSLDADDDYHIPDHGEVDRYEELIREVERENVELEEKRRERDERARNVSNSAVDEIREGTKSLRDDVERAFREIKTRDHPEPRRRGQRVNARAFARLKAGNRSASRELYIRHNRVEMGDRSVCVSLDLSGSMNEEEAKKALVAIQEATDAIGDEFSAVGFKTRYKQYWQGSKLKKNYHVELPLITAPDESFKFAHLESVSSSGSTPTANGVLEATKVLEAASKPEKVVIVVTDGKANKPLVTNGTLIGDKKSGQPKRDTKRMIRRAREKGMTVVGLGVDTEDKYMKRVFGDDYVTAEMDHLADALVDIYRSQMEFADEVEW